MQFKIFILPYCFLDFLERPNLKPKLNKMKKIYLFLLFFLLNVIVSYAAVVDTLQIPSLAMNKTYKAAVVLPNAYAKSKTNFPVLYLLHGAYGHFQIGCPKLQINR